MQANKTAAAELIPGTEILYDLHGGQSQDEETRILIPRPSSNEDDPLVSKDNFLGIIRVRDR